MKLLFKLLPCSALFILTFLPVFVHAKGTLSMGSWQQDEGTLVQTLESGNLRTRHCQKFLVELKDSLTLTLDCNGEKQQIKKSLIKNTTRSVKRLKNHITITQFAFQNKKIRVSQFDQDQLRIPYVEEVVHVSLQPDGRLALHWESFTVDQFGRIVQSDLIKAYGLKTQTAQLARSH